MPVPTEHLRRRVAFWTLAAVALLISHDAVFLVQLGPGESLSRALREAAHGYWGAATLVLACAGAILAGITAWRLVTLRRRAFGLNASLRPIAAHAYLGRATTMAGRLFVVVAIGFVLQENLEHVIGHGHAPGLGALLGPEYPLALPVIGAISAVAGLLGGIIATTADRLVAGIMEAIARRAKAPRTVAHPSSSHVAHRPSPLASRLAGRAPPIAASTV